MQTWNDALKLDIVHGKTDIFEENCPDNDTVEYIKVFFASVIVKVRIEEFYKFINLSCVERLKQSKKIKTAYI